jgi:hypothetical protein
MDFLQKRALVNSASPKTLERLANDDDYQVRIYVAQNPNTPPETLDRLAKDESGYVRMAVAENPNTLPETLNRMSKDVDSDVRYDVAQNPNTPPKSLRRLANDRVQYVRCEVAENPNTTLETLIKLFGNNKNKKVRNFILKNPSLPEDVKEKMDYIVEFEKKMLDLSFLADDCLDVYLEKIKKMEDFIEDIREYPKQ